MAGLYQWLFTDAVTENSTFHFYVPWLIACALALIIPFYYSVEGRKRFLRDRPIERRLLDKLMGWAFVLAIIALILMGMRWLLDSTFFSWRAWRYLWLLACLAVVGRYGYYLIRRYPKERADWRRRQVELQYRPKPKTKTRAAMKRG